MTELVFPPEPYIGQPHTFGNKTWVWNGAGWSVTPATTLFAADAQVVHNSGDEIIHGLKTFADGTATTSMNGGQLAGNRNKIINGDMRISQRGTSFVNPATNVYCLDRWGVITTNSAAYSVTQSSDVPSNEFQNSLQVTTNAVISEASSNNFGIRQQIEGYNARDLIGRTFTLSFWVKSSKAGIHCVGLRNAVVTVDRSYIVEYTVLSTNTWEHKTITVPGGLITDGTWNWANGSGLQVSYALEMGTDFQTTPNAWQIGNYMATANQVNCLDTVGNIFAITGVQLEAGEYATPFEHRNYGAELMMCKRYFEAGAYSSYYYWNSAWGAARQDFVPFTVQKRAAPTITATFAGPGWTGTWSITAGGLYYFIFGNNATTNTGSFASSCTWRAEAEL